MASSLDMGTVVIPKDGAFMISNSGEGAMPIVVLTQSTWDATEAEWEAKAQAWERDAGDLAAYAVELEGRLQYMRGLMNASSTSRWDGEQWVGSELT